MKISETIHRKKVIYSCSRIKIVSTAVILVLKLAHKEHQRINWALQENKKIDSQKTHVNKRFLFKKLKSNKCSQKPCLRNLLCYFFIAHLEQMFVYEILFNPLIYFFYWESTCHLTKGAQIPLYRNNITKDLLKNVLIILI